MLIVADSSALIALAICHSLYLLDTLFAEIKVPPAVFQEVTEPDKPVANVLKNYLMDKVSPIVSTSILIETGRLGRGELEAMVLYKELQADYLLLDDHQARKVARYNNIKIIGSLGTLLLAKEEGHLTSIRPLIEKLQTSEIYLSDRLIEHILILAGE